MVEKTGKNSFLRHEDNQSRLRSCVLMMRKRGKGSVGYGESCKKEMNVETLRTEIKYVVLSRGLSDKTTVFLLTR